MPSIQIGSLLDEYGRAIFEESRASGRPNKVSREIALVERVHGNLLDHTWFDKNEELIKNHPLTTAGARFSPARVGDRLLSKLARLNGQDGERRDFDDDESYIDPLSHLARRALILLAPGWRPSRAVPKTNWVTVVQERRSAALEPVQDMNVVMHDGWWALLASCGLIGVLWYFVGCALNDRTPRLWSPAYGRRARRQTAKHKHENRMTKEARSTKK